LEDLGERQLDLTLIERLSQTGSDLIKENNGQGSPLNDDLRRWRMLNGRGARVFERENSPVEEESPVSIFGESGELIETHHLHAVFLKRLKE
jgi:hypothetical protein